MVDFNWLYDNTVENQSFYLQEKRKYPWYVWKIGQFEKSGVRVYVTVFQLLWGMTFNLKDLGFEKIGTSLNLSGYLQIIYNQVNLYNQSRIKHKHKPTTNSRRFITSLGTTLQSSRMSGCSSLHFFPFDI